MQLPPPPGRLIDVGSHRLHLHRAGAGVPVLFESAMGASSLVWRHVQALVSGFACACAYDRAGFGWSDAGPLPRTAGRIATELRAVLVAGDIRPPYVLVGHSFGGLTARIYADRHPDEIAGLVLLDPASPEEWRRPSKQRRADLARAVTLCRCGERAARLRITDLLATLVRLDALDIARTVGRLVSLGEFSRGDQRVLAPAAKLAPDVLDVAVRTWTHGRFFEALGSQIASLVTSAAEVSDTQDFGTMPLVVVSSEAGCDARQLASHASLAGRSRCGRHIVARGSGHWIPLDRPDVVVAAIRDVLPPSEQCN